MSLQIRITDLITAIGTDYKQLRTWITGSSSGSLAGLTTTSKASVVAALNEVNAKPPTPAASETVSGISELATLGEVAAGGDTIRVVTPAGVRQERVALKAEILGVGVPAALDTLDELAAALGDNASFATSVTTSLGNRVRVDTATQGLTLVEQGNARANVSAVALSDIGNADADLVALYAVAKT